MRFVYVCMCVKMEHYAFIDYGFAFLNTGDKKWQFIHLYSTKKRQSPKELPFLTTSWEWPRERSKARRRRARAQRFSSLLGEERGGGTWIASLSDSCDGEGGGILLGTPKHWASDHVGFAFLFYMM